MQTYRCTDTYKQQRKHIVQIDQLGTDNNHQPRQYRCTDTYKQQRKHKVKMTNRHQPPITDRKHIDVQTHTNNKEKHNSQDRLTTHQIHKPSKHIDVQKKQQRKTHSPDRHNLVETHQPPITDPSKHIDVQIHTNNKRKTHSQDRLNPERHQPPIKDRCKHIDVQTHTKQQRKHIVQDRLTLNSNIPQFLVRKTLWIHFFIVLGVALYSFITVIDKDSSKMLISLIGFIIGFAIYGPISIAGVIALESSPKNISGTTYAVAALFSNIGIFLAGLPFSYIAKQYDLQTTFLILGTFSIIMFLYLIFKLKYELSSYRGGLMKVLFMK
ncbi:SLC37A4 [Mytilus coruscus]|uniref:SLC37A4 n=1 Tax=Mytilus coruscus TaxID=42192 RepID=A0A6J8BAM0_MYTCO|nr:SLC37A4 [Mytilus coruscus]